MLDLTPKGRDETGEADGLGPSSRPLRAGNAGEVCADARLMLLGAHVRGASRRQRLASWLGKNISRSVADRSRPRPPRRASSAAYTIRASAAGWSLAPRQWQARRFSPRSSRRYSARGGALVVQQARWRRVRRQQYSASEIKPLARGQATSASDNVSATVLRYRGHCERPGNSAPIGQNRSTPTAKFTDRHRPKYSTSSDYDSPVETGRAGCDGVCHHHLRGPRWHEAGWAGPGLFALRKRTGVTATAPDFSGTGWRSHRHSYKRAPGW